MHLNRIIPKLEKGEEIDVAPGNAPGKNFGWPAFEGPSPGACPNKPLGGPSPHTPPLVALDRRPDSGTPFSDFQAVIGGRVYRGPSIPALQGVYFFSDFSAHKIGALRYCNGRVFGPVIVQLDMVPDGTDGGKFNSVTQFVEGHDHELYAVYGIYSGIGARIGRFALQ